MGDRAGHILETEPATIPRANELLHLGRSVVGRLEFRGWTFSPSFAHFSRGPYPTGHRVRFHRHDQLQIQAAITGHFEFETAGGSAQLGPLETCLISAGRTHRWRCVRSGVLFGMLIASENPLGRRPDVGVTADTEATGDGPPLAVKDSSTERWLRAVEDAASAPQSLFTVEQVGFATGAWLARLFNRTGESLFGFDAGAEPTSEPVQRRWGAKACERAVAFMDANLRHPIRLQEIASEAGLSTRHLSRLFRLNHGCSVHEHLTELRLREAKRQLRANPDKPIKAIAHDCGFRQPGYLTRSYRRRFGRAPSEDR